MGKISIKVKIAFSEVQMKKRKYLYRLAMSVFLILLLPMVIFIVSFGKYSYEKVEDANRVYCEALMDYYMVQLDQMIIDLKEHAASICADSKKSASIFWEKDAHNNYWYYQAMDELKGKYSNYAASDFGIYYYEEDKIVTAGGIMSPAEYFRKIEIKNLEEEEYLKDFFEKENYEEFLLYIGGTEDQGAGKNKILIGFYTTLGRQRDKVMLFYEYTERDITEFFESAYIEKGFECSLWNKNNGFSFFFGNYSRENYEDTVKRMLAAQGTLEGSDALWVKESSVHPIVLIGYMNENAPRNVALAFLDNMLTAVSVVLMVVLVGYLLILYIAYKPVFHLTTKLKHAEGSEFEAIAKALDDRGAKIEEQEILLMDMLINNLLYKAPISKGKLKQLGIEPASCYTVFLLDGYVLSDAESKKLIAETAEKYCSRMFVTDLDGENRSVFVLFFDTVQENTIKEWLQQKCSEFGVSKLSLVGGNLVYDIKEIWRCLNYCEEELKKSAHVVETEADVQRNNAAREMKKAKLREEILSYVGEHYRDIDLTQVQVAGHFNISTYTLSRIFRNDVGIGFVAYVNAKRVEYAKELLLTTKESVHDIAVKSGFDNDNNFFKVFKANTGMSPTTFRES